MGLTEVQRLLARLYTDAELRERFFVEPGQVGEAFGLTTDEAYRLAQLSAQQVGRFAASLQRKRLNGVARLLPLTRRALGERFDELFQHHADAYLPVGRRKQREDALTFCAFLARAAREVELNPAWVLDVARYEAAKLRSAEQPVTVCAMRHTVPVLMRGSEEGALLSLPVRPTLVVWLRFSRRSRPWQLRLPLRMQSSGLNDR
jgi:hypothetical protein